METSEKDLQIIAKELENIQKIYQKILEMKPLKQEQLLLQYVSGVCEKHEDYAPVKTVCEQVLAQYPDGVDYYETTLIGEAISLLKNPYKAVLPASWFEKDMLLYKLGYALIEDLFDALNALPIERRYQLIVDNLKRHLCNALVNNPNFKGQNPYYKRHYQDFQQSKKLTRELLDQDFSNFIAYFKGD